LRDGRFSGRAETGQPNRNALMVLWNGHSQYATVHVKHSEPTILLETNGSRGGRSGRKFAEPLFTRP
jgi:hypothetical protein